VAPQWEKAVILRLEIGGWPAQLFWIIPSSTRSHPDRSLRWSRCCGAKTDGGHCAGRWDAVLLWDAEKAALEVGTTARRTGLADRRHITGRKMLADILADALLD
jgi:hypothetical protein